MVKAEIRGDVRAGSVGLVAAFRRKSWDIATPN